MMFQIGLPVSQDSVGGPCFRMNGPLNLSEIEKLGWNMTVSVTLQFEFLKSLK